MNKMGFADVKIKQSKLNLLKGALYGTRKITESAVFAPYMYNAMNVFTIEARQTEQFILD